MNITKQLDNNKLFILLEGRLDTASAPVLEEELKNLIEGISELEIDMASLQYISSAGLRVLLSAQKTMNKQGSMLIRNVNDSVREVFDITGFSDIFTIK